MAADLWEDVAAFNPFDKGQGVILEDPGGNRMHFTGFLEPGLLFARDITLFRHGRAA